MTCPCLSTVGSTHTTLIVHGSISARLTACAGQVLHMAPACAFFLGGISAHPCDRTASASGMRYVSTFHVPR